jgi:hypothetical protein
MAVGLRAPYLGYVLRACLAEEMLGDRAIEVAVVTVDPERIEIKLADTDGLVLHTDGHTVNIET